MKTKQNECNFFVPEFYTNKKKYINGETVASEDDDDLLDLEEVVSSRQFVDLQEFLGYV